MGESTTSVLLSGMEALQPLPQSRLGRRSTQRLIAWCALALTEIVAVQFATVAACLIVQGYATYGVPGARIAALTGFAGSVAALASAAVMGLFNTAGLSPLERFGRRVNVGLILPWFALEICMLAQPATTNVFCVLFGAALFYVPLSLLLEASVRQALISRSLWGADVVIIGSGAAAQRVAAGLLDNPETGLRPVGYYSDPGDFADAPKLPWLGLPTDLGGMADIADIAVVVSSVAPAIELARLPFKRIVVVPDVADVPAVGLRTIALGNYPGFVFINVSRAKVHHCVKRVMDLMVAVPGLLLAIPVMAATMLVTRLISPGPLFYVQRRVGRQGRPVTILKLRSMYPDADRRLQSLLDSDPVSQMEWQTYVKLSRDPRILPYVGNFIRRTSIDELPQLWNVIRGDISMVGPRPFPQYHIERFSPEFQRLRCSVLPGLTGLWQVSVRSSADTRQQELIDTFYIRNWSLWLDLYIMMRTVPAILSARGAR